VVNEYELQQQTKEERVHRARRRRFIKRVLWVSIVIIVVGSFLGWLVWAAKHRSTNLPGTFYPAVGREHIGLADTLSTPYNSNPPSSGAHYGTSANWGIYDYEVNDKIFLHNLEHGGVWIAYRPSISGAEVNELERIVDEFGGSKIVMAPRLANDADIALVAWTRVEKFDLAGGEITDVQKNAIRDFYRAYRDHGPEFVPDNMPGIDPKSVQ
jgi:hypothetical protein